LVLLATTFLAVFSFAPAVGATSSPDGALAAMMLTDPLPGYAPGSVSGPLDAQTYAQYAPNAGDARSLFARDRGQPGFAAVIRTWQDASGHNQVRELALCFHQTAEAGSTASAYERVLSDGAAGSERNGNSFTVDGLPEARGYLIAATAPNSSVVTDELQVVVIRVQQYLFLLETDAQAGPANPRPVPSGTAATLAERQFPAIPGALSASEREASPAPAPTAHATNPMWLALAAVIAVLAVLAVLTLGMTRVTRAERPHPHRRHSH
jgi:hypothetical protein